MLNAATGMNNSTQKKFKQFVLSRKFDAGFTMGLLAKDLSIALQVGRETGTPAPLSGAVQGIGAGGAGDVRLGRRSYRDGEAVRAAGRGGARDRLMRWKFWQRDDDEEWEEFDEPDEPSRAPPEFPQFAMVISETAVNGWHMGALVRERANIDFYVRALVVRWPFVIARPIRSNRQSDITPDKDTLSPASTGPAHKLVVNWAWEPVDGETSQLRFYAKRKGGWWTGGAQRLKIRMTVKQVQPPRRRVVVRVKSNRVAWKKPDPKPKAERARRFRSKDDLATDIATPPAPRDDTTA